ncbi:MAG: winged helix-turn-helix transcriptional regulator [Oscillospiraceae bacterium]|nr:winged helix-turn-helix transcriptional regulator [Oscillospiraceae bacterium]
MPQNKSELLTFMQLGSRTFERMIGDAAAKWQLSASEIEILLFLDQMPHLDTARDVALHCGMSKASVSGNVLKLATRGLLTVDVDLKDRRFQHLTLTEQVTPILADTRELLQRFDTQLLSALTEDEREQFLALLSKVNTTNSSLS